MKARPLREDHIVGIGAILHTLNSLGALEEGELLAVCHRYGLRAGSVPWVPSLRHAQRLKVIAETNGSMALTTVGSSLTTLVVDLEPTDALCQALVLADIGSRQDRRLSHAQLEGDRVRDPRLAAGQLLNQLAQLGLFGPYADGAWELLESDFTPLLHGLMCQGRGGNPALKGVGDLGELLTKRYYEDLGWSCLHASKVSDVFGFDLLFRREPPTGERSRAVEAKATRSTELLRIFLSVHELRVAQRLGERYEIVVWGGVDLEESLEDNYVRLRRLDYPVVIRDPVTAISQGQPGLFDSGLWTSYGRLRLRDVEWEIAPPTPRSAGPRHSSHPLARQDGASARQRPELD